MCNPDGRMPLISVIIPTKNRRETLIRNLGRLHACSYQNLEVIVVDDGSTDGSQAALSKLLAPQVVRLENSVGPGWLATQGWPWPMGDYMFFIDDDSYVVGRRL